MKITCFIEYQIDPFQIAQFEAYAKNWGTIIPQCGGELLGYFLPHEGTNNIAYGLISFESLAHYEQYRATLRQSTQGANNFDFAKQARFIISEKRTFLKALPESYLKLTEPK